jgi:hypothetical protein
MNGKINPPHFSFAILVLFPYGWIHSFKHQEVNDHVTGALPSKLPRERTTEQEAWIRIRANSNGLQLYHRGAPTHPLIYPDEIID